MTIIRYDDVIYEQPLIGKAFRAQRLLISNWSTIVKTTKDNDKSSHFPFLALLPPRPLKDWFENDQLGYASCSPPSRLLPASTSAWLPYVSSSSLIIANLGTAGWCHSALLFICIWEVFL